MLVNGLTPYRRHFHERIVREIPGLRLATLVTHDRLAQADTGQSDDRIGLVDFSAGDASLAQGRLRGQLHEWRKAGRIIRWFGQNPPAVIVVATYNDIGRLRIIAWAHRAGIPVLLHADSNILGDQARGLKAIVKSMLLTWVIKRCSMILPFGTMGRRYFEKYGAAPDRIIYCPCESDYSLFETPNPTLREVFGQRLGLRPDRRRLLYCGRLIPEKGVGLLLEAYSAIVATRPDWDLVICGDGILRAELEAAIPLSLKGRIFWTGNLSQPAQVATIMQLSDILILPSQFEPWGIVVTEAASAGLALVCSDAVGAAYDLLHDGENGRFFKTGNLASLAGALADLTGDVPRLEAMQASSRRILSQWRRDADPVDGLKRSLGQCLAGQTADNGLHPFGSVVR